MDEVERDSEIDREIGKEREGKRERGKTREGFKGKKGAGRVKERERGIKREK